MWLSSVGFANDMQAVVYDRNGANYCGRLWWMLKWAGHDAVAVLDGGLQAWQAAGGEVTDRRGALALPVQLQARPRTAPAGHHARTCSAGSASRRQTLVDARGAPRFRGEVEPLDPVAGHIPGALEPPVQPEPRPRRQVQAGGRSCAPSSNSCWAAAIRPRWCTTAAAA